MKLFYSATSPFVRKVMVCAIIHGLDKQIRLVPTNPHQSPDELTAANPLSKVPCLVTDDGLALFDSPVICEYLDEISDEIPLLPVKGAGRWRALKLQAIGDGLMDAAVARRGEMAKPQEAGRDAFMARQKQVVERTLGQLEAELPADHTDLGTVSVACALGYLDFRFPHEPWRPAHPGLAAWFEQMSKHRSLAETVPRDPA